MIFPKPRLMHGMMLEPLQMQAIAPNDQQYSDQTVTRGRVRECGAGNIYRRKRS